MKARFIKFFLSFTIVVAGSCTPLSDPSSTESSTSCGVLSTMVESYSENELTLKLKFFVLDSKESDQLIKRNIENNLVLYSSDVIGTLVENKEVTTNYEGSFSSVVLLDEVYNTIRYDTYFKYNVVETFLRKFFKNAGNNNSFLFSILEYGTPIVKFYGKPFKSSASELDLQIAEILNNVEEPISQFSNIPLLRNIDILLDTINKSALTENRHLLLLYSRSSYLNSSISGDSVINKAIRYGIKVSTIMDYGGEYYIDYDLGTEDLFFKLANLTGGFVYKNNEPVRSSDLLILASRLGNILEGNFRCFESTWRIIPKGIWTDTFQTGFYADGNLEIDLGTQYLSNVIDIPFGIYIK